MPQYLLSMHMTADAPPERTPEEMERSHKAIEAVNHDLKAARAWVFGGALHGPDTATVVRERDGDVETIDGPFVEGKEHIGGFYVISVADRDEAQTWASRTSAAIGMPIEVRPFDEVEEVGDRPTEG